MRKTAAPALPFTNTCVVPMVVPKGDPDPNVPALKNN